MNKTPINNSTNPTNTFPMAIDKVESMSMSSFLPLAIEMTSFDTIILKQPPSKAPINALSKQ